MLTASIIRVIHRLMMEAVSSCFIGRCYIAEDSHIFTRPREISQSESIYAMGWLAYGISAL
jgi:hypothetical protein